MTQNLAIWNDQREDIFLSILKKKRYLKKKYSMSDLVVYKIKGKFLRMNLLSRLREIKKNSPRNTIFKGTDSFVINW